MSTRKYIEIECDGCGCAEHFQTGNTREAERMAVDNEWIVAKGYHYDSFECMQQHNQKRREHAKQVLLGNAKGPPL